MNEQQKLDASSAINRLNIVLVNIVAHLPALDQTKRMLNNDIGKLHELLRDLMPVFEKSGEEPEKNPPNFLDLVPSCEHCMHVDFRDSNLASDWQCNSGFDRMSCYDKRLQGTCKESGGFFAEREPRI